MVRHSTFTIPPSRHAHPDRRSIRRVPMQLLGAAACFHGYLTVERDQLAGGQLRLASEFHRIATVAARAYAPNCAIGPHHRLLDQTFRIRVGLQPLLDALSRRRRRSARQSSRLGATLHGVLGRAFRSAFKRNVVETSRTLREFFDTPRYLDMVATAHGTLPALPESSPYTSTRHSSRQGTKEEPHA